MILIFTEKQDITADKVCKWLFHYNASFVRINNQQNTQNTPLIQKNTHKDMWELALVKTVIEKVNLNAPAQFQLLCKLESHWHKEFKPFKDETFELITKD